MRTTAIVLIASSLLEVNSGAWAEEQRTRNDEPAPIVFARVPEKARGKRNPFADDSRARSAGEKLFGQHCAECHGESAEGTKRGPNLRGEQLKDATPGALFWIVTNGIVRRGMPAWSKLPEPQRWQIVTFLLQFVDSPQTGVK